MDSSYKDCWDISNNVLVIYRKLAATLRNKARQNRNELFGTRCQGWRGRWRAAFNFLTTDTQTASWNTREACTVWICKEAATYSTLGLFSLATNYILARVFHPRVFFSIDRKVPKLFNVHPLKFFPNCTNLFEKTNTCNLTRQHTLMWTVECYNFLEGEWNSIQFQRFWRRKKDISLLLLRQSKEVITAFTVICHIEKRRRRICPLKERLAAAVVQKSSENPNTQFQFQPQAGR